LIVLKIIELVKSRLPNFFYYIKISGLEREIKLDIQKPLLNKVINYLSFNRPLLLSYPVFQLSN